MSTLHQNQHSHKPRVESGKKRQDSAPKAAPDQVTLSLEASERAIFNPTTATPQDILHLQNTAGNQAVSGLIQAKLRVGPVGDAYEQEADRVAEKIIHSSPTSQATAIQREAAPEEEEIQMMPAQGQVATVQREAAPEEEELLQMKPAEGQAPAIQREAAPEEEELLQMKPAEGQAAAIQREAAPEEEELLQMKPAEGQAPAIQREAAPEEEELQMKPASSQAAAKSGFTADEETEQRLQTLRGSGQPLPRDLRSEMEAHLDADLSGVRLHTNSEASQLNRRLAARAFTHGKDIYLDSGEYNPASREGKRLLAHELTHVVQQTGKKPPAARPDSSSTVGKEPGAAKPETTSAHANIAQRAFNPKMVPRWVPSKEVYEALTPDEQKEVDAKYEKERPKLNLPSNSVPENWAKSTTGQGRQLKRTYAKRNLLDTSSTEKSQNPSSETAPPVQGSSKKLKQFFGTEDVPAQISSPTNPMPLPKKPAQEGISDKDKARQSKTQRSKFLGQQAKTQNEQQRIKNAEMAKFEKMAYGQGIDFEKFQGLNTKAQSKFMESHVKGDTVGAEFAMQGKQKLNWKDKAKFWKFSEYSKEKDTSGKSHWVKGISEDKPKWWDPTSWKTGEKKAGESVFKPWTWGGGGEKDEKKDVEKVEKKDGKKSKESLPPAPSPDEQKNVSNTEAMMEALKRGKSEDEKSGKSEDKKDGGSGGGKGGGVDGQVYMEVGKLQNRIEQLEKQIEELKKK